MQKFVQALADGCKAALQYVSTFWMKVPSPVIALKGGAGWHGADALVSLQQTLLPVTAAVAVISFAVALAKIAMNPERAREGFDGVLRQILVVLLSTIPAMAASQLLITFGDLFSPWVIKKAAGMSASQGFQQIIIGHIFSGTAGSIANDAAGSPVGLFLVLFLLGIVGSIVQCFFMLFRGAALLVLFVILPAVGASAATDEGWVRYKRLLAVIVGFILYKPVAAIVYATGMKLMAGQASGNDTVQNAILGLTIITMAALALPAFIKFLLPAAAMGSSSAFSGGAGLAAVAAGAAVVGLSGGAAAPAAAGATGGGAGSAGAAAGGAAGGGAAGGGAGGNAQTAASGVETAAGGGNGGGAASAAGTADGASGSSSTGGSSGSTQGGSGEAETPTSSPGSSEGGSSSDSPRSGAESNGSAAGPSGAESSGADSGQPSADSGAESRAQANDSSGADSSSPGTAPGNADAGATTTTTTNGSARGAQVVSEGVRQVADGAERAGDDAAEGAEQ